MNKKHINIIKNFNNIFEEIALNIEETIRLLDVVEGRGADSFIIVPRVSRERLCEEIRKRVFIAPYSLSPEEVFQGIIEGEPRPPTDYLICLEEEETEGHLVPSFYEALMGFLLGSITECYCSESYFRDDERFSPYFSYSEERNELFIDMATGKFPAVKKYRIAK